MEPTQWLTRILFGLTILAVITHIIDNRLSALVGVALMGQAKGNYTFLGHLKWTPAIALGDGVGYSPSPVTSARSGLIVASSRRIARPSPSCGT